MTTDSTDALTRPPFNELSLFQAWPKMARLSRGCTITEKLDGTNAQISIVPSEDVPPSHAAVTYRNNNLCIFVGSRTRWIWPGKQTDNYGFAGWVRGNAEEILKLGIGRHFGEWYGAGIQRTYGLKEKRFALFNTARWIDRGFMPGIVARDGTGEPISCCHVVPVLYQGEFNTVEIGGTLSVLKKYGSVAVPEFMRPEGIVIYHAASGLCFKKTIENDESPKSRPELTSSAQLIDGVEAAREVFESKVDKTV